MPYDPLPQGWGDVDRKIHVYLFLRGPHTLPEICEALQLYPEAPRYIALRRAYKHMQKLQKWGYVTFSKREGSRENVWMLHDSPAIDIYTNPSYIRQKV